MSRRGPPVRRDTPSPGAVQAVLALGAFTLALAEFMTMSLLPQFSRSFAIDAPTGGRAVSAYALGVVVGAPVVSVLAARMSRRVLLMLTMGGFALGATLSAAATSFGVLVAARFLSGLPHAAFLGAAALAAAGSVPAERRPAAVGRVMTGFAAATIVGVPLATLVGRHMGWRASFAGAALLALVATALVAAVAPRDAPQPDASPRAELQAFRNLQVWLTLAIGAIGFGGMFAFYTYLASTLHAVTRAPDAALAWVLAAFGLGMTAGNLLLSRLPDRAVTPAIGAMLAWSAVSLALYPLTAPRLASIALTAAAVGGGGALGALLQARLMRVAGEAQQLAAALNHCAFNVANALGPWLGGAAIAAGYGWTSVGWVGSALACAGLCVWTASLIIGRGKTPPSSWPRRPATEKPR